MGNRFSQQVFYRVIYIHDNDIILSHSLFTTEEKAYDLACIQAMEIYKINNGVYPDNMPDTGTITHTKLYNLYRWTNENLGYIISIRPETVDDYNNSFTLLHSFKFSKKESSKETNTKHKIMEIVDSNKEDIKSSEYLEICNYLMKL